MDPAPPVSLFVSARWQFAFIELEILLGLWLISGLYPRGAWVAGVTGFGLLAGVSLYLAALGSPSCGCFGKLVVSPWLTSGLDIVALIALWHWRPQLTSSDTLSSPALALSIRSALRLTLWVIVLLTTCFVALSFIDSSPSAAFAVLRGEPLTVEPPVTDLGSGVRGEVRTFRIQVRNHTDRSIRLIGGTADCSCVATIDLPIIVPARENRMLSVRATFGGTEGVFQQPFVLLTDDETQPRVVARFTRVLVESSGE